MTLRIKKKVDFIKRFDSDPKDNLSETDYKIFKMMPMDESVFARDCNDERETQLNLENVNDRNDQNNAELENDNSSVVETQEEVQDASYSHHCTEDIIYEFNDDNQEFERISYRSPSRHDIAEVCENVHLQESLRIPGLQKERLVQLIQNDFYKLFGQFTGTHGSFMKTQAWAKIASELNTLGPLRTVYFSSFLF